MMSIIFLCLLCASPVCGGECLCVIPFCFDLASTLHENRDRRLDVIINLLAASEHVTGRSG